MTRDEAQAAAEAIRARRPDWTVPWGVERVAGGIMLRSLGWDEEPREGERGRYHVGPVGRDGGVTYWIGQGDTPEAALAMASEAVSPARDECRHGTLRRKCEPCDLAEELAEARAEVERLRALLPATATGEAWGPWELLPRTGGARRWGWLGPLSVRLGAEDGGGWSLDVAGRTIEGTAATLSEAQRAAEHALVAWAGGLYSEAVRAVGGE
jgi:hypothetical protein